MSARGALHGGPNIHSASVECPVAGCGLTLPSRGHLGQHRRRVHDAPSKADRELLARAPAAAAKRAGIGAGAASVSIAIGRGPEPEPVVALPAELAPPPGDERRGPLLARFMARANPNVEPVSAAIVSLPWVSFPRDRISCEAIARAIDAVIAGSADGTDGEAKFWRTLGEHIVAIAGQVATR